MIPHWYTAESIARKRPTMPISSQSSRFVTGAAAAACHSTTNTASSACWVLSHFIISGSIISMVRLSARSGRLIFLALYYQCWSGIASLYFTVIKVFHEVIKTHFLLLQKRFYQLTLVIFIHFTYNRTFFLCKHKYRLSYALRFRKKIWVLFG